MYLFNKNIISKRGIKLFIYKNTVENMKFWIVNYFVDLYTDSSYQQLIT